MSELDKKLHLTINGKAVECADADAAVIAVIDAAIAQAAVQLAAANRDDALYDDSEYEAQRQAILTSTGESAELAAIAADIAAIEAYDTVLDSARATLVAGTLSSI